MAVQKKQKKVVEENAYGEIDSTNDKTHSPRNKSATSKHQFRSFSITPLKRESIQEVENLKNSDLYYKDQI